MKDSFEDLYEKLVLDRKYSNYSKTATLKDRQDELEKEIQELRQAIMNNDTDNLKEELGDALWDLLSLMIIADEKEMFTTKEVIEGAIFKLKSRKPWVFEGKPLPVEEELARWHEAKRKEKGEDDDLHNPNTNRKP